jgi:iron complex transport system permease protein
VLGPQLTIGVLAALLPVVAVIAVGLGQYPTPPLDVARVVVDQLTGAPGGAALDTVVWQLRVPRVLLGAIVGAALAASGAALQAVVRNDLADPYLLGVSSGATLGASLVIATGLGAFGALLGATGGAFLGALVALGLVLALLGGGRRLTGSRLVLAGLIVGYFLGAATNLVVTLSDDRDAVRSVLFWSLGSLTLASWNDLAIVAAVTVAAVAVFTMWGRRLDSVGLGDDVARSLGIDPSRLRLNVAIIAALTIAAAVAVSGAIGFVGLIVPHLARRLVGAGHRRLIITSALLGGIVLVVADALARTALAPREIPLGVLTALVGTPLLMALMYRRRRNDT